MAITTPRRILIVEDEYLLADDLRKALADAGATVVGPVATEEDALALMADGTIDCAILDINLRGRMVYPLAGRLRDLGVPFLFVSGYEAPAPDSGFQDIEMLQKPCTSAAIVDAVDRLMRHQAGAVSLA